MRSVTMRKVQLPGQFAQYLLGEEDHGEGFAAALRVPEDTEPFTLAFARGLLDERCKGIIDAEVLMVHWRSVSASHLWLR